MGGGAKSSSASGFQGFWGTSFHCSTTILGKNKKFAFTLAEVLITLGIIGVVAAMTMPTLVAKYEEKATVTKLKKMYSTLSQGYLFAVQEYGTPSEWGITGRDAASDDESAESYTAANAVFVRDRLLKNVKTIKVCNNAKDQKACGFADAYYQLATGTKIDDVAGSLAKSASASLADGSTINLMANGESDNTVYRGSGVLSHTYAVIYYDINGIKPPNTAGKDLFFFYLTNQNIMPCGTENETYHPFSKCSTDGYGCAAWVIYKENMDYLHCKDLSWNGKDKCK